MVNAFHSSFTLAPLAPLAEAPVSSPEPQNGAGYNPSKPLGTDWRVNEQEMTAKLSADRRGAIARARAKVEAGDVRPERQHQTKAERLASPTSNGKRETGSLAEQRAIKGAVAKATEKVGNGSGSVSIRDKDFLKTCDRLRQRWPNQSLATMIATAEATEAEFHNDPVAAREMLIARYARRPKEDLPKYHEKEHEASARGSFRRAFQFRDDAEELAEAEAKYGDRLPHLMRYIDSIDSGMFEDPHGTSARMATSYGAPAVASQVPQYEQIQEQRQAAKIEAQQDAEIHSHIESLIADGHVPRDEDLFMEIGAILQDPRFQHTTVSDTIDRETAIKKTIWRAAQIAQHSVHVRITPSSKATAPATRDPGTRSISGAGTGGHFPGNNGRRSARDVLRSHLGT